MKITCEELLIDKTQKYHNLNFTLITIMHNLVLSLSYTNF